MTTPTEDQKPKCHNWTHSVCGEDATHQSINRISGRKEVWCAGCTSILRTSWGDLAPNRILDFQPITPAPSDPVPSAKCSNCGLEHPIEQCVYIHGAPIPADPSAPLPCPFCGSSNISVEWEHCEPLSEGDTNRRWFAECQNCCAEGPFCQKEPQVIPAWNRRALQATTQEGETPEVDAFMLRLSDEPLETFTKLHKTAEFAADLERRLSEARKETEENAGLLTELRNAESQLAEALTDVANLKRIIRRSITCIGDMLSTFRDDDKTTVVTADRQEMWITERDAIKHDYEQI